MIFETYKCGAIPSPPDARDYSIKAQAPGALPERWKRSRYPIIGKQSAQSCTNWASSYAYEMCTGKRFSKGYLYGEREPEHYQGEGRYSREVADTMLKRGNVLLADYPYEFEVMSAQQHVRAREATLRLLAAENKLEAYGRAYSEADIKTGLIAGHGVIFCGACESFKTDKNGFYRMRTPTYGYHEMAVCDYDGSMFYCAQSWGKSFGKKGFCYVPGADILRLNDVLVLDFKDAKKDDGSEKESVIVRTLRKGMKGEDVKQLQEALINLGYALGKCGADGDFGSATKRAVEAFQKAKGLKADGIAGKATLGVLYG